MVAMLPPATAETFKRSEMRVAGPIDYGQTTATVRYTGHPRFTAFQFNARPGDHVEITVHAKLGAPVAYLANDDLESIAGGQTHFEATIPPESKPATWTILVTDPRGKPAVFTVELQRPSTTAGAAAPEYLSCSTDYDCVAVDRAGCCHNGYKDAVNKNQIGAYQNANACHDPHRMCAILSSTTIAWRCAGPTASARW